MANEEVAKKPGFFREFILFIGHQGIMGLAIGFIFGTAISDLVSSFVADIIDPVLGLILVRGGELESAALTIGSVTIAWGKFVRSIVDFAVIAIVVFLIVHFSHLKKIVPRVTIVRRS